jgi:hypothetical protein
VYGKARKEVKKACRDQETRRHTQEHGIPVRLLVTVIFMALFIFEF